MEEENEEHLTKIYYGKNHTSLNGTSCLLSSPINSLLNNS